MIRVLSFCNCVALGFYRVNIIKLDSKGNDSREVDYFPDYNSAREHVSNKRRQWLLETFGDFVRSTHVLFKSSSGDHYKAPLRLNNLTRLINAASLLPSISMESICQQIILSEPLMISVLPHKANPGFDTSLTGIYQMVMVCNEELENKLSLFDFKSTVRNIYL